LDNNEKNQNELLQDKIFVKRESSWKTCSESEEAGIFEFCEEYKEFLKAGKTERLCVREIVKTLEENGFADLHESKAVKSGEKAFVNFRNKAVVAFVAGKDPEEMRIVGSHLDSPRLDLKPFPFYEDSDIALLKTHYYGGIKKYHWVNIPLALHGVVHSKDGRCVELSIGEKEGEPRFIVPDLLIHLSREQLEKKASKTIEAEELNLLAGNIPVDDEKIKEKVKFAVIKKLYEEYGITEEDFAFAEIEITPAGAPCDIGFDGSMIGAYGQDDRACVFTSLKALLNVNNPRHTAVAFFSDKEEIGSTGDTGAESFLLKNFAIDYVEKTDAGIKAEKLLERSKAISADVTCAMNPNYKSVNDPSNVSYLGRGVSVEKYSGSGGKYEGNDASAEYMAYIRNILVENDISWQTGELGKVDVGGGGTIAGYLSRYGMQCVDAGPCMLGMHSTCEVSSKADIFSAYRLYRAFFED